MKRIRDHLLTAVDLFATFTLAVECAVVGVRADLDLFGIMVLAFVGSVGGGVIRDLLLGEQPPAAFRDWRYAGVSIAATVGVVAMSVFVGPLAEWTPPLVVGVFDTLGLALAVVAGTRKSLDYGVSAAATIIIATVNGCGGGILRDVLTAQVPHVMRADFYATIALLGAMLMLVLVRRFGVTPAAAAAAGGIFVFALRTVAIVEAWSLPHLR